MRYQNIKSELREGINLVVVDRPKKLNALNRETIEELHQAMADAELNDEVKVVILTGSGDRAFVAGADIAEFSQYTEEEGRELAAEGQRKLFDFIANFSKPVIAAINGYALGGGLELAMAAHFRLASDNVKLGLPEVSLGLIPGYGGTQRLPQIVGKARALELIMTAEMIDANQALQYHLVNHVVAQEDLLSFAFDIARKIMKNSLVAISTAIKAVNANYDPQLNGYEVEIEGFGASFATQDFKEGTTAFLEKRKPNFPGK